MKQDEESSDGVPPNKSEVPGGASSRVWVELPDWAKQGLREIAQEEQRSLTRQAAVVLMEYVSQRLGSERVRALQRPALRASTEASE